MVFWRSRAAKKAESPVIVADERPSEREASAEAIAVVSGAPVVKPEAARAADPEKAEPERAESEKVEPERVESGSNVVPLIKTRLADRLADVADKTVTKKEIGLPAVISPAEPGRIFGQSAQLERLRAALSSSRPGEHTLILGAPGTGRMSAVRWAATEIKKPKPDDWIYLAGAGTSHGANALPLPPGQAHDFVQNARIAIAKASANLRRQLGGDEHRLDVELLNEELRFRADKAVEGVRRRAEAQNIALVKSLDGYVLAPMHEGRVVRSDVFHALPEALRRNVEAKISSLEVELQQTVAALPTTETQIGEKFEALFRETARRAVKPYTAAMALAFTDARALAAIEAINAAFTTWGTALAGGAATASGVQIFALSDAGETAEGSAVVEAHEASALDLVGCLNASNDGRVAVTSGHLMRGAGGIVVIEAWKLAAEPRSWLALSACLASSQIVPRCGRSSPYTAEPLPLTATVVLIADPDSWAKICAIEPGASRHFQNVVKFSSSASSAELSESDFAQGAARLAADFGLKTLASDTAEPLHKDAMARGSGRVSLDRIALLQTLRAADHFAATAASEHIRSADIASALARPGIAAP